MGPERVLRAADDERSTADKVLMLYAPTFLSLAIFFVSIAIKRKWHELVAAKVHVEIREVIKADKYRADGDVEGGGGSQGGGGGGGGAHRGHHLPFLFQTANKHKTYAEGVQDGAFLLTPFASLPRLAHLFNRRTAPR